MYPPTLSEQYLKSISENTGAIRGMMRFFVVLTIITIVVYIIAEIAQSH